MIEPTPSFQQPPVSQADDSAAAAGLPALASGQRYRIRQEIGRGFSSIVYEALDTVRERTVALKVLTLGQTLSDERRQDMAERFLREARAISALSHPGIVSVYEVGQAGDGRHFIAMELLAGECLRARLDREAPLPPEDAVPIALQVADALEYAHSRGIVHRDIKPDNIYVLPDGRVKLMDFGVAHILTEGALTQTGTVVGSPAYMSPEQISGLPLSGSSDVFSLGVTLTEMLTGHKPFDAPSIPAVMNRILHRPPQIDGVQPRALRKVVEKALAKSQAARFLTASAFADALRRPGIPGFAAALATDTVVMPGPLPRPRPAASDRLLPVSDLAQEPPSKAALWTFGIAGLALLVGAPLALSHLSLSSSPTVSASVRTVSAPAQQVAQNTPTAQVAHIPATWGRQPVRKSSLTRAHAARKARHASPVLAATHTVKPVQVAAAIVPVVVVPRPAIVHPAVAVHPQAVRPAAVSSTPDRVQTASVLHPAATFAAAAPSGISTQHAARLNALAAQHQARLNALAAKHAQKVAAQNAQHARPAQVAALGTPLASPARQHAVRPPLVRVADSRQEQSLPTAPAVRPAPSLAVPAPRSPIVPDSQPRLLRHASPVYPDSLRAGGIGGTVFVRLSVNAQGTVTEATVTQSSGTDDLDAAALDAVGHWFYEPAYQDGKAVPAQVMARIDFRP